LFCALIRFKPEVQRRGLTTYGLLLLWLKKPEQERCRLSVS
jgi:hypothetical protein